MPIFFVKAVTWTRDNKMIRASEVFDSWTSNLVKDMELKVKNTTQLLQNECILEESNVEFIFRMTRKRSKDGVLK